jgi:SUKH-3 immunity protein
MLDEDLLPSTKAESVLRKAGWSPSRKVDISAWVQALRSEGNEVSPVAEAILRRFGGLVVRHREAGGASFDAFDVNPAHWIGMRDAIADVEEVLQQRVSPLGMVSGGAMLGVLDDGRVISELEGFADILGHHWREALDHLTLGRGRPIALAADYVPCR